MANDSVNCSLSSREYGGDVSMRRQMAHLEVKDDGEWRQEKAALESVDYALEITATRQGHEPVPTVSLALGLKGGTGGLRVSSSSSQPTIPPHRMEGGARRTRAKVHCQRTNVTKEQMARISETFAAIRRAPENFTALPHEPDLPAGSHEFAMPFEGHSFEQNEAWVSDSEYYVMATSSQTRRTHIYGPFPLTSKP